MALVSRRDFNAADDPFLTALQEFITYMPLSCCVGIVPEQYDVIACEYAYMKLCQLRVARSFGEDKRFSEARLAARAEAWSHAIMLIAATLIFCGRKGIALDRPEPDCLTLDEIFHSADRVEIPGRPALTREDLREAVKNSQLIDQLTGYYRFENQSDLEFLASSRLASLKLEQLQELLGSPDHERNWRVFPQLAATAANLAAQSPDFFNHLLKLDPRVLMRVDFASTSEDHRHDAVDAILGATAKIGATGGHNQHAHFSTLYHPKITEVFPASEAPQREGGYTLGSLDYAYDLRRDLQSSLEARGAHAELSFVYHRCDEAREAGWSKSSIDRAQNIAHASRHEPPTAAEFIRFLATEGGTFVSDNDSLQRAVLASLRRFEQSLKPDGLLAIWEKGEPRSEEVLQVEIARHLRREFEKRRIVVNMETKILSKRSDIRVQAGPHSVTIEVKLGHSKDSKRPLRTAMRSQLRTYLENQNETHGIYVVGWFFSPTFLPSALQDMKTLSSARRYFDKQARKISTTEFVLAAAVIDCRWPETIASRGRRLKTAARR